VRRRTVIGFVREREGVSSLPCCGLGHRVGDVPVPRLSSTGAVTIAADLTSGGASVRPDPEFAKKKSATAVDAAAAAGAARSAPRAPGKGDRAGCGPCVFGGTSRPEPSQQVARESSERLYKR
jgi:hypothetical protein